jgi:hypothetical protein
MLMWEGLVIMSWRVPRLRTLETVCCYMVAAYTDNYMMRRFIGWLSQGGQDDGTCSNHLRDQSIHGKAILKHNFKELCVRMWTGFHRWWAPEKTVMNLRFSWNSRNFLTSWMTMNMYEGVTKSFRTGLLERELQMVWLPAARCSCIAILWVSLVRFAAITFVLLLNE